MWSIEITQLGGIMKTFSMTDVGKARTHNEDSVIVLKMPMMNIYLQ